MNLLQRFHKAPFWSQLVFGLVAIFALPEIQAAIKGENEPKTVINQPFAQYAQYGDEVEQQALFIAELNRNATGVAPQAVVFYGFSANIYRFDAECNHPIRAGPSS